MDLQRVCLLADGTSPSKRSTIENECHLRDREGECVEDCCTDRASAHSARCGRQQQLRTDRAPGLIGRSENEHIFRNGLEVHHAANEQTVGLASLQPFEMPQPPAAHLNKVRHSMWGTNEQSI